jgi:hypothetical protein
MPTADFLDPLLGILAIHLPAVLHLAGEGHSEQGLNALAMSLSFTYYGYRQREG